MCKMTPNERARGSRKKKFNETKYCVRKDESRDETNQVVKHEEIFVTFIQERIVVACYSIRRIPDSSGKRREEMSEDFFGDI